MQLSLCLFCFFVFLAGLEKCLGRTHSPQMLSFGKCGRVCATMMGTSSSTGVCVCFNLDLCVSCGTFLSECLLFAFPVFCNTSTRDWNTESAGWGHSPPPQSHVSLHASLYSEDHIFSLHFFLTELLVQLGLVPFSAHDLRTPGSSQSSSPVHPSIPVSFNH